jgi:ABC-type branched-subunit amino acid transport system permease subunit
MGYIVTLLTIICIYTILTSAMDLILGYAGLFSFVHAALAGIGSYAAAALMVKLGWGLLPAFGAALVVTAIAGLATAAITVRLDGHYFILGTFCVANVVESLTENWTSVTNGTNGLYGIPVTRLFGWTISPGIPFLLFCATLTAITLVIKWLLVSSPYGLTLQAIRDDETVAWVLGNNVRRIRTVVFVIGASMTALAGVLLACYLRYLDPTSFSFSFTILIWAALFVGGGVSTLGSIVGPAILVLFPEALRFIGLSGPHVANVQQALYGLLLILLMMFRPQGFFGHHSVR